MKIGKIKIKLQENGELLVSHITRWCGILRNGDGLSMKQMDTTSRLRVGDKVEVISNSGAERHWSHFKESVGRITVLTQENIEMLEEDGLMILFDNKYSTNFTRDMVSLIKRDWDI